MSIATFKIEGRLDGEDGGTVTINRSSGIIGVRPKGRRRTYDLRLIDVAEMIVCRVALAEVKKK